MTTTAPQPVPDGLLDPEDLARCLLPLGPARTLPSAAYTDPRVLAWERRNLFAGSWTCVGRDADLRADGVRQRATTAGDVPVLLLWADEDAPPRAFANTCRHRGHELLADGAGSTNRSLVCPYHAWTYALDGSLRSAPGFREDASFDPSAHGLVELPLRRWRGWLLVHALGDAAAGPAVPFEAHLGALDDVVGPYAPEQLHLRARHDYEVAANWKVLLENYHECYHCPLIHPELCQVSPPTSGDNHDLPGAWVGGSMLLREGMATMSLTGASGGAAIAGADPGRVEYVGLLPNLLVSAHPDYVMTHRLTPLDVDRTAVECAWYLVDPEADPAYAVDFWDLTNRQDWAACESVQRGTSSPHHRPGPLAPNEDAVHRLTTMLASAYLGRPPHEALTSP